MGHRCFGHIRIIGIKHQRQNVPVTKRHGRSHAVRAPSRLLYSGARTMCFPSRHSTASNILFHKSSPLGHYSHEIPSAAHPCTPIFSRAMLVLKQLGLYEHALHMCLLCLTHLAPHFMPIVVSFLQASGVDVLLLLRKKGKKVQEVQETVQTSRGGGAKNRGA